MVGHRLGMAGELRGDCRIGTGRAHTGNRGLSQISKPHTMKARAVSRSSFPNGPPAPRVPTLVPRQLLVCRPAEDRRLFPPLQRLKILGTWQQVRPECILNLQYLASGTPPGITKVRPFNATGKRASYAWRQLRKNLQRLLPWILTQCSFAAADDESRAFLCATAAGATLDHHQYLQAVGSSDLLATNAEILIDWLLDDGLMMLSPVRVQQRFGPTPPVW